VIGALYGCGCGCGGDCVHLGELGDDSIDLSTIDFGSPQPVVDPATGFLAPTSFPSLDSSTILEPSGSFQVGSPIDVGVLPTDISTLPSDLSAADASLMPVPVPAAPSGGGGTVASNVATGALAAGSLATAIAKLFRPAAPAGWTYNSAGTLVPTTAAAGTIPPGFTRDANGNIVPIASSGIGSWFTGKTLISSLPNWAVVGGGVGGVILLSSLFEGGGRRRR
jgi:hypothetical protein